MESDLDEYEINIIFRILLFVMSVASFLLNAKNHDWEISVYNTLGGE